jgi:2-keto-4-pentenoate hydratase
MARTSGDPEALARVVLEDGAASAPFRILALPSGRPLDAAYAVQEAMLRARLAASGGEGAPQDPLEGLVWAARTLALRGRPLRAGMILPCGTHLPVQAVDRPGTVRATMGELGTVGFSLV